MMLAATYFSDRRGKIQEEALSRMNSEEPSVCKSRESRNTWSKGKFGLGVQNEAGQRLIEFCQENALVIAKTLYQQHKRRLYTWT